MVGCLKNRRVDGRVSGNLLKGLGLAECGLKLELRDAKRIGERVLRKMTGWPQDWGGFVIQFKPNSLRTVNNLFTLNLSHMKYLAAFLALTISLPAAQAQLNPAITAWLQNTTGYGSYYTVGNYTPQSNNILYNCQLVQYNSTDVYTSTKGIPSYPTGPFLDGNPSNASNQNAIFRFPLAPTQNTGTPTPTNGGNIGVFINGVALFDYRDGVSWNTATGALCGGPGNPTCTGSQWGYWNRDAVKAELSGFDCAKGHPAMGNYHHHQNPSAFKYDLVVLSTICNLYDSEALYVINSGQHSPLLGYAYDGFPIYGSYGYLNLDGTGGITRMKSGYQLRNITVRTHWADGTDVPDGPAVSATYPLGYFREDYEWVSHPGQNDYLDVHNGRVCVTPEYPSGIYCYFATVNASHNSAYPYVVGPTFYGNKTAAKVTSVPSGTIVYTPTLPLELLAFDGRMEEKDAVLTWKTADETGNDFFTLERSADGVRFEQVATVPAHGSGKAEESYSYIDEKPPVGKLWYRLSQTDLDGRSVKFPIISLQNTSGGLGFTVSPNPADELLLVQTDDILRSDELVELFDECGKLVVQRSVPAGSTFCHIETTAFQNGNYALRITQDGHQRTRMVAVSHR